LLWKVLLFLWQNVNLRWVLSFFCDYVWRNRIIFSIAVAMSFTTFVFLFNKSAYTTVEMFYSFSFPLVLLTFHNSIIMYTNISSNPPLVHKVNRTQPGRLHHTLFKILAVY
jgi:hypothetical protein